MIVLVFCGMEIGTYDLQVVEIDFNGCEGTPSIVTVNLVSQPSAISPISNVTSCVNQLFLLYLFLAQILIGMLTL